MQVVIDRHDRYLDGEEESFLQPVDIESYNCLPEIRMNLIHLLGKTLLGSCRVRWGILTMMIRIVVSGHQGLKLHRFWNNEKTQTNLSLAFVHSLPCPSSYSIVEGIELLRSCIQMCLRPMFIIL